MLKCFYKDLGCDLIRYTLIDIDTNYIYSFCYTEETDRFFMSAVNKEPINLQWNICNTLETEVDPRLALQQLGIL
jgi:hypothetical protein